MCKIMVVKSVSYQLYLFFLESKIKNCVYVFKTYLYFSILMFLNKFELLLFAENGFVEFDEFVILMRRWHQNSEADGAQASSSVINCNEKKLEAFKVFDMDGNGFIDEHELKYTMRRLGETDLSNEDIKAMFVEADLNGDGLIDFNGNIPYLYICIRLQQ